MFEEAIRYLYETGQSSERDASLPKITKLDDQRRLITMNGQTSFDPIQPPNINRLCLSMQSLIEVAEAEGGAPRFWIGRSRVEAEYSQDTYRRSCAAFEFVYSGQWHRLKHLETNPTLTQREAVRLFFHDMRGCVDAKTHNLFRKLDWSVDTKTRATVQRSQESLGREVLSAVNAADAIPEELEVQIPVFNNLALSHQMVRVTIDIDHAQQKFLIQPEPNAMDDAQNGALEMVRQWLSELIGDDRVVLGIR